MNARNEMKRTMKAFGEPIKIISHGKIFKGAGIFRKIFKKFEELKADDVAEIGNISENKYCLWIYDYQRVDFIEKVICRQKTYSVISGNYDSQIGCWRLVVGEGDDAGTI